LESGGIVSGDGWQLFHKHMHMQTSGSTINAPPLEHTCQVHGCRIVRDHTKSQSKKKGVGSELIRRFCQG
jgi:hypothetical protein